MKTLFSLTTVIVFFSSIVFSQDCEWCERRAILFECSNDVVENSDVMYPGSVMSRVYEINHPPCFYWMATQEILQNLGESIDKKIMEYNMAQGKPPDYFFKAYFRNGGIEGKKLVSELLHEEGDTLIRDANSELIIELYYNGETEKYVDSWISYSILNNVSSCYNRMFNNPDSEMKKKKPLDVMWKFEQTPTDCSVLPEKETIPVGDTMEIKLSDFKGLFDGIPKHFNRIVVHSLYGEIRNGDNCKIGPDYKVFTVGDGNVTLKYKAPEDCENSEDRITIYNSCNILPKSKWPMENTETNEIMKEQNITIDCWDATIVLKKKVETEINFNKVENSSTGSCKTHSEDRNQLNQHINAEVRVNLKLEYAVDIPIFNQTYEYYKPVNINLTNFNYNSQQLKYSSSTSSGIKCSKGGFERTTSYSRTLVNYEFAAKQALNEMRWILAIDNKTKKAVKLIPAGYTINFHISENENTNSTLYSPDGSIKKEVRNNDQEIDNSFEVGPVVDEISDPTVQNNSQWIKDYLERQGVNLLPGVNIPTQDTKDAKGEINPDLLVKSGDGQTSFGGEGSKTINEPNEYGFKKEEQTFSWQMTRKKKNK